MATLTVAASTDYRTPPNSSLVTGTDITLIDYTNAGTAVIDLNASQFGGLNVSNTVTLDGNANANQIRVTLSAPGSFSASGWLFTNWSTGADVVFLDGSSGNDTITGSSQADRLLGGAGADSMSGGIGADAFDYNADSEVAGDVLDGGADSDVINMLSSGVYRFYQSTITSVESARFFSAGAALFSSSQIGAGAPISQVVGSNASIQTVGVFGEVVDLSGLTLSTWSAADGDSFFISGGYGAGTLSGTSQDDVILGGSGSDSLVGGGGADALTGDNGSALTFGVGSVAQSGTGTNTSTATATSITNTFSLSSNVNIENATANPHTTITSGARTSAKIEYFFVDLTFVGTVITVDIDATGGGLDSFVQILNERGQVVSSNDNFSPADPGSATTQDSRAVATTTTPGRYYIAIGSSSGGNIANLALGHSYQAHVSIDGELNGAGNDTLDGGAGVDTMTGGAGNDVYTVDHASDVVTESAAQGTDTVRTALANYVLAQNVEVLVGLAGTTQTLTGNASANTITGGTAADFLGGGEGNDTLTGGGGNDTLSGGPGDDTYNIETSLDAIIEITGAGTDTVISADSYIFHANVENATLTGIGNFGVLGNDLANVITGNSGGNGLAGGLGNDTIDGGPGFDTIDGQGGSDQMSGGTGADVYFKDAAGDVIVEVVEAGVYDTIWTTVTMTLPDEAEILILNGGNLAINGTGNDGASNLLPNLILGNNAVNVLTSFGGDDIILGLDGNDTINTGAGSATGVEVISGGRGADTLTSGGGHDYFTYANIDEAGDTITDFGQIGGGNLDILDLRPMWPTFTNTAGITTVAQAVASGHLAFQQSGANTLVQADTDGGGNGFVLLATLNSTTAATVQALTLI